MKNIEHIGIAVRDLGQAVSLYERLLGSPCYKTEEVPSEGVSTAFFQVGENKIELLAAIHNESPIAGFLEKRGEGIHHIAFKVADILSEMERLKSEGFVLLNEVPKQGADQKLVCFVHPKGTNGVLVELCQDLVP
ncbi:methylmalonyl-CoA epimerase [Pedobacter ginsengisoli]|uniref:methylmalonyl-CoA epimerase n=1 Tax=Pedobacter ginsengisoli TaxID=363852 RepID=UPI00254F3BF5|nr:methylmalonyl-CoA epimerase [Pedobacter ginsengisoli]